MVKISIIIPVYNSISYLEDCVRSLSLQSFCDFEVWLIDDGSTDGSGELCDALAKADARIHVMHSANFGAAHARQLGIEKSTGEYLYFVDSDDTLPTDGLERMYQRAEAYPISDIIIGFCREHRWKRSELSSRTYRNMLIEGRYNIGTLWGKLFRRSLFCNGIPTLPKELVMGEDMLINIFLAFATDHPIQVVKGKRVYNYIQRETGISRRFTLTADYEQQFHKERLRMIPIAAHPEYMNVMIHRRFRMLRRLIRNAMENHTLAQLGQTEFVKCLCEDVVAFHFTFWNYPRMSVWKFLKNSKKLNPTKLGARYILF